MNTYSIIAVSIVSILVIATIVFIVWHYTHNSSSNPSKPPDKPIPVTPIPIPVFPIPIPVTPIPVNPPIPIAGVGTLFLTAEKYGLDSITMDIPKFSEGTATDGRSRFKSVALVWLDSGSDMETFYSEMKELVYKNNPDFTNFEYWIQLDVDKGDTWPTATCSSTDCIDVIYQEVVTANNKLVTEKITGLYFDNESVNDEQNIVNSMNAVSNKFVPKLKLGFTKGIKNCSTNILDGVEFDYCMGQTYTNETADLFLDNCGKISMDKAMAMWMNSNPYLLDGFSTPLFCGGGNCQRDMDSANNTYCCLDERLYTDSAASLMEYMNSDEMRMKFPNFGFWFGSGTSFGPSCDNQSSCAVSAGVKSPGGC